MARVSNLPFGSRTNTHRMDKGGNPPGYQTALPEATSTLRLVSRYQWRNFSRCQAVLGSVRTCWSDGRRVPTSRGRPLAPLLRGGAALNRRASKRIRVTHMTDRLERSEEHTSELQSL